MAFDWKKTKSPSKRTWEYTYSYIGQPSRLPIYNRYRYSVRHARCDGFVIRRNWNADFRIRKSVRTYEYQIFAYGQRIGIVFSDCKSWYSVAGDCKSPAARQFLPSGRPRCGHSYLSTSCVEADKPKRDNAFAQKQLSLLANHLIPVFEFHVPCGKCQYYSGGGLANRTNIISGTI